MRNVIHGYRVDDVPGICWRATNPWGPLQVLIFPREIQEELSATEGRFQSGQ